MCIRDRTQSTWAEALYLYQGEEEKREITENQSVLFMKIVDDTHIFIFFKEETKIFRIAENGSVNLLFTVKDSSIDACLLSESQPENLPPLFVLLYKEQLRVFDEQGNRLLERKVWNFENIGNIATLSPFSFVTKSQGDSYFLQIVTFDRETNQVVEPIKKYSVRKSILMLRSCWIQGERKVFALCSNGSVDLYAYSEATKHIYLVEYIELNVALPHALKLYRLNKGRWVVFVLETNGTKIHPVLFDERAMQLRLEEDIEVTENANVVDLAIRRMKLNGDQIELIALMNKEGSSFLNALRLF
eukprot:TRINITY_DN12578_c0_g1_i1.p1 TRINITY_DN12578_c0_g1~~TRINITY_DN12578_c0_g1_i1.p1  ORF type:complete len:302 (-),score=40.68 TRINITY_DN12578_c0_g1_i1:160-1065(-)